MALYDPVAGDYSRIFTDITLRIFEWPWLKARIAAARPRDILDLGCGNGYLSEALAAMSGDWGAMKVTAVDPSGELLRLARQRFGPAVTVLQCPAERLELEDGSQDLVISFLSFRYMDWEEAAAEVHRVLRPGGRFIVIDLFAGGPGLLSSAVFVRTWLAVRGQRRKLPGYHQDLKRLAENPLWKAMVAGNSRRRLGPAIQVLTRCFQLMEKRLLSQGLRGRTVGLVLVKTGEGE